MDQAGASPTAEAPQAPAGRASASEPHGDGARGRSPRVREAALTWRSAAPRTRRTITIVVMAASLAESGAPFAPEFVSERAPIGLDMAHDLSPLGWQGLHKGTAVAGADTIGCGPRELGGNRAIGRSGRESSRMLRQIPPRLATPVALTARAAHFKSS
jgi:hypothetical protein